MSGAYVGFTTTWLLRILANQNGGLPGDRTGFPLFPLELYTMTAFSDRTDIAHGSWPAQGQSPASPRAAVSDVVGFPYFRVNCRDAMNRVRSRQHSWGADAMNRVPTVRSPRRKKA